MTLLWLCVAWVFASAAVAMLPMRLQYVPGIALLVAAPVLVWNIWASLGPWVGLAAIAAVVSMYRNPLRYFWAKARGKSIEAPK